MNPLSKQHIKRASIVVLTLLICTLNHSIQAIKPEDPRPKDALISKLNPLSNELIELTLNNIPNAPPTKKIQLTFTGNGCGSFKNQTIHQHQTILKGKAAQMGRCIFVATFYYHDGTTRQSTGNFTIINTKYLPLFEIANGNYEYDKSINEQFQFFSKPLTGFKIKSATLSPIIKNQATLHLNITHPNINQNMLIIFISQTGHDGSFETGIVNKTSKDFAVTLTFKPEFFQQNKKRPIPFTLNIAASDYSSHVTPIKTQTFYLQ